MRKAIASAALVLATVASHPAMAWGAREQGIVTGIVGTIVAQQLFRPPVVVAPPPPVAVPGPVPVAPPVYAPAPVPVVPWNPAQPYGPVVPYYPGTVYPDFIYRPMYKDVDVWIPECECWRTTRVRVN